MDKNQLRDKYRKIRKSLSEKNVLLLSEKITRNFFKEIDVAKYSYIHSFFPLEKLNEVRSDILIEKITKRNPQTVLSTLYPVGEEEYENYMVVDMELKEQFIIKPSKVELAIVPLLAFDKELNRLGLGRGVYDRFMSRMPEASLKVGLAFDNQLFEDELPTEEHDRKLDLVVTETMVYRK